MKTFGADANRTTQNMVTKAKSGQGTLSFTPKSQFGLPKSNKKMPPKKVNAVLNAQSDAAVGMPKSGGMKAMKMKG